MSQKESESPIFAAVEKMHEPWRSHFPKSMEEAKAWKPAIRRRALHKNVLVVARTRIEGAWAAYIDAVPGINHDDEEAAVFRLGNKLPEKIARTMFPALEEVPYAP